MAPDPEQNGDDAILMMSKSGLD